jgi:hypothetical protein
MSGNTSFHFLRARKRPLYAWILWLVWILWIGFWLEVTIGSYRESEPRAYAIGLVVLLVSLLAGFHVWLVGHLRHRSGR